MSVDELLRKYKIKKPEIESKLAEFKRGIDQPEKRIFAELCFCLCTPQSKARFCDEAIQELEQTGVLFSGSKQRIKTMLRKVRFPNNKSQYILLAREMFSGPDKISLKKKLQSFDDPFELREWLVKNVKGLGWKESSHFLRNIGVYQEFAILDKHILKNLNRHGVTDNFTTSLSKKKYLEIEKKMQQFADKINIPLSHLDLLFWSKETGEIFK